jgi:hypothetical protein
VALPAFTGHGCHIAHLADNINTTGPVISNGPEVQSISEPLGEFQVSS